MPTNSTQNASPEKSNPSKKDAPPVSAKFAAKRLADLRYYERNKEERREKARIRAAEQRQRIKADPELAKAAAAKKREEDAKYRKGHREILKKKQYLRREEVYWRTHHQHRPQGEKTRDYAKEYEIAKRKKEKKAIPNLVKEMQLRAAGLL
ncbi:hypothetical protein C8R46DRAFT_1184776 [Mycena filopes]|nr:hypothetical protein C8R46DRAFT_1184776 [Mycena filopes]